ncbi:hypothetical protein ABOM_003899 [Aspergillus bombycis]|uniref:Xylanolytic transcriptional activator regulatory domain-containing protein n=1 Tax=Aspergillus bombycis TaxID=109264 RepID=A0A1F8A668_9EURO|nr:hypothetical protein ABOM_003899 [Aspergillus bombycis]OGM47194.1 hypothetical protein ABOM_003899 [Aspergillus bombycis]
MQQTAKRIKLYRSAKVKCHHDGSPPCRSCSLNPGRECVLSTPKHQSKRHQNSLGSRRDRLTRVSKSPKDSENREAAIGRSVSHTESARVPPHRNGTQSSSFNGEIRKQSKFWTQSIETLGPGDPLAGLDGKLLKDAFYVFLRHFPEFGFFHQPTFCILLDKGAIPTLLLCSILALSARFMPELANLHGSPEKASEYFANYTRQNIMSHAMTAMDIHTGQTLLMLSLYDWGNGDGSRAWVYNGMATRIVHGVYAQAKESAKMDMSSFKNSRLEEACRTVWACFLLDSMIGCGKCQASNFSMSTGKIPLPSGEDDFAFGNSPSSRPTFMEAWDFETNDYHPQNLSLPDKMGCDHSLVLIVQGFHIWQAISSWVSTGGRRRQSPSSREPPWRGCSFWSRSMAAVKDWRASQSPQLIFSASNINIHVYISRGEGERFAVINLLYYLNIILLHREYIPFVPHLINRPQGPVQPPLLMEEAPFGWWEKSAQDMFAAASNIIEMMRELNKGGVQFQTPFACFCVFSAASALSYATTWPYMAPGLDPQTSSSLFSWASTWLSQACKFWKVANGWYSTMLTLCQLYTQIKMDPSQILNVRRDVFVALEENIQRLAGSETLDLGDIPTANILLLLQRQQGQTEGNSEASMGGRNSFSESNVETSQGVRDINTPILVESGQDPLAPVHPLPFYLNSEQDLLASILSDPSGDWTRPFIDTTQLPGS